jgi:hypothetical protein
MAFLRVNYTLIRVGDSYEPQNGSIYRVTLKRGTLKVLSIAPSNWSEMRETLSICSKEKDK